MKLYIGMIIDNRPFIYISFYKFFYFIHGDFLFANKYGINFRINSIKYVLF